jgi:hypothetical protein
MKRTASAVMGAAVMVLWATAASAQSKFDGKWAMDQEKTAASNPAMQGGGERGNGGGGGANGGAPSGRQMGGMGGAMSIAVSGGALVVTRTTPNGDMVTTYKLDGVEQTIAMGQREQKVTAKQDGDKIVLITKSAGRDGAEVTSKSEYSIDGDYLVISSTRPGPEGEVTRKTYYKKAS